MTQQQFAPDLEELREDARHLEAQLRELQARLESALPQEAATPIDEPWNVAPYSWAIGAWRWTQPRYEHVVKCLQARIWHRIGARTAAWKLARHNARERFAWRDASHDETELRLVN